MRRYVCWLILFSLVLSGCAKQTSVQEENTPVLSWQEQYDLGLRYLSEGNYEEAIIAFTAAIEIDPKQASAYVGRGNAYVLSGDNEENLNIAQTDFEHAIELGTELIEAYLGLADIYIYHQDYANAVKILEQGKSEVSESTVLLEKIAKIKEDRRYVSVKARKSENGGGPWAYGINEYNLWNELIRATVYNSDDTISEYWEWEYNDTNQIRKYLRYDSNHQLMDYVIFEYDVDGNMQKETSYNRNGEIINTHTY